MMRSFIIFIILLIIGLIYIIYLAVEVVNKRNAMNPVVVNDAIDADVTRPAFNLPEVTMGLNQSFSTWIYVKDFNYFMCRCIFVWPILFYTGTGDKGRWY